MTDKNKDTPNKKTGNNLFLTAKEYFESQPEETRQALLELKECILKVAPNATELINYNILAYSLIKGALDNFTRYLATYYAAYNIRANIVCPGGIYNNQGKEFKENYEKLIPLGRMAVPEDIVGAIVFLASDSSSYITGQTFMIDGGLSAW